MESFFAFELKLFLVHFVLLLSILGMSLPDFSLSISHEFLEHDEHNLARNYCYMAQVLHNELSVPKASSLEKIF